MSLASGDALVVRYLFCASYLDALLVECVLVKVEDGRLDGAGRGEHGQANVDGVAPLGIQNNNLLTFAVRCRFLGDQFTETVKTDLISRKSVRFFSILQKCAGTFTD